MLELLILLGLGKYVSKQTAVTGRSPLWAGLVILFWLAGELMGFTIAEVFGVGFETNLGVAYLIALVVAMIGAVISISIVNALPALDRVRR